MTAIVEVTNLDKRYAKHDVLTTLNFTINRGDVVGLLGKNGAGKSTLLECLMNLKEPNSGSIKLWGKTWQTLTQAERERIGFVAQSSAGYNWMKVSQYLDYMSHFFEHWDHTYCDQLVEKWQLDENQYIDQLSGGQKQILDVVQALSIKPELLVLDEPVAHLDPNMRRQFLSELMELCCEQNTTVIFSTHIVSDLERIANKVAILMSGKIIHHHDLDDLKNAIGKVSLSGVTNAQDLEMLPLSNTISQQDTVTGFILEPSTLDWQNVVKDLGLSYRYSAINLEDWYLEVAKHAY